MLVKHKRNLQDPLPTRKRRKELIQKIAREFADHQMEANERSTRKIKEMCGSLPEHWKKYITTLKSTIVTAVQEKFRITPFPSHGNETAEFYKTLVEGELTAELKNQLCTAAAVMLDKFYKDLYQRIQIDYITISSLWLIYEFILGDNV